MDGRKVTFDSAENERKVDFGDGSEYELNQLKKNQEIKLQRHKDKLAKIVLQKDFEKRLKGLENLIKKGVITFQICKTLDRMMVEKASDKLIKLCQKTTKKMAEWRNLRDNVLFSAIPNSILQNFEYADRLINGDKNLSEKEELSKTEKNAHEAYRRLLRDFQLTSFFLQYYILMSDSDEEARISAKRCAYWLLMCEEKNNFNAAMIISAALNSSYVNRIVGEQFKKLSLSDEDRKRLQAWAIAGEKNYELLRQAHEKSLETGNSFKMPYFGLLATDLVFYKAHANCHVDHVNTLAGSRSNSLLVINPNKDIPQQEKLIKLKKEQATNTLFNMNLMSRQVEKAALQRPNGVVPINPWSQIDIQLKDKMMQPELVTKAIFEEAQDSLASEEKSELEDLYHLYWRKRKELSGDFRLSKEVLVSLVDAQLNVTASVLQDKSHHKEDIQELRKIRKKGLQETKTLKNMSSNNARLFTRRTDSDTSLTLSCEETDSNTTGSRHNSDASVSSGRPSF